MEAGKEIFGLDTALPSKLPTYDKGYWSALKLLLLKYYIKPYLNILGPRKSLAYVDLFAGPGLDLLGENQVPFPGSPLIPLTISESKHEFSHFCFCDLDTSYARALEKRCCHYAGSGPVAVLNEDANEVVNTLNDRLEREDITHSLIFVDPEGLEMEWASLEILVETIPCDLIINFPSAGLARLLGRSDLAARERVSRFLGVPVEVFPLEVTEDWAIGVYRENLARLGKDISTEIRVMGTNSFHYHLIPAVRRTHGGSPWFPSIFGGAKRRIERISPNVLRIIADQIEGTQQPII